MRIFQIQRITAVALLVFMTIHMIVVHYPPFHIDFSIIAQRMVNPVWKVIEILFLLSVLMHGLAPRAIKFGFEEGEFSTQVPV